MHKLLTVRQIRKTLFDTDKSTVIDSTERNNKESRDFLYAEKDQEKILMVMDFGTHLILVKWI